MSAVQLGAVAKQNQRFYRQRPFFICRETFPLLSGIMKTETRKEKEEESMGTSMQENLETRAQINTLRKWIEERFKTLSPKEQAALNQMLIHLRDSLREHISQIQ